MEVEHPLTSVSGFQSLWVSLSPDLFRQTTQGNRLSCRDQEGRRGSEEAVPGPSALPLATRMET